MADVVQQVIGGHATSERFGVVKIGDGLCLKDEKIAANIGGGLKLDGDGRVSFDTSVLPVAEDSDISSMF